MAAFSEGTLISLLKDLSTSRSKILNFSSWLIYHKRYYQVVVKIWFEQFLKANDGHKVALLYLLNEIVQNGKKCPDYVNEFGRILPKAFKHASSLNTYEEKLNKDVLKLLKIWSDMNVFSQKQIVLFSEVLDSSKISKCDNASLGVELEEIKFEDVNEFITLSPHSFIRGVKTEDVGLIERLNFLTNPPTYDAEVRGEIGSFPRELFDLDSLKSINNKKSANKLMNRVNYALKFTSNYNARLQYEMEHREKLNFQLNDFIKTQKEMIFRGKERLKKYRMKLIRLKTLERQMQSFVRKLPDMPECPIFKKELSPLPSAGDLFN